LKTVGEFITLDAPLSKINVHVRGGFIIPMQTPGANLILGRGNPFTLLVAQSQSGNASGNLFWDDGDSIGMLCIFCNNCLFLFYYVDSIETKSYNYFEFTLTLPVRRVYVMINYQSLKF